MYKLLFFLGILIFILCMSYKEGFEIPSATSVTDTANSANYSSNSAISLPSIGKYDYLKPIPIENTWNPDIKTKFINRFNIGLGTGNDKLMLKDDDPLQDKVAFALEKEAVYYINNGKFPINLYVKDYLDANPDLFPPQQAGSLTIKPKNLPQFLPNRLLYGAFIAPKDAKREPPPEAYNIYIGDKTLSGSSSSSTLSPADIETLKTVTDVKTLKSISSKY